MKELSDAEVANGNSDMVCVYILLRIYIYNNALCLLHVQSIDQKNIRRRVYDALNVLMAMNIISKEKKEIQWIGLPTNSAQECQHVEVSLSDVHTL